MEKQIIEFFGDKISIPACFSREKGWLAGSSSVGSYSAVTNEAFCSLALDHTSDVELLGLDQQSLVSAMRARFSEDDQGLVASEQGTANGRRYLYCIARTLERSDVRPNSIRYSLFMLLARTDGATRIQGDFTKMDDALMSLSEHEELDESYPGHPLSVARSVVRCILGWQG